MTHFRGKYLPRRTFLKGIGGVAVALPLLDAMIPAFARAEAVKPPKRFGIVYFPNGSIKEKWTPAKAGTDYDLSFALEPLQARKQKLLVLSNLADDPSKTISGFHDRAIASIFTGVERSKTEVRVGISVDQLAARTLGKDTQLRSLELAAEESLNFGYPLYSSPTDNLPFETNPRAAYERLFGDSDSLDPAVLEDLRKQRASILDGVSEESASLKRDLGASDCNKLDEYFESLRDIESRLNARDNIANQKISMERPVSPPSDYADLVRLMFDLQVVALRTDKTRVWSFMMGGEASNMEFPDLNWFYAHHLTSHHGGDPVKIEGLSRINRYQVGLFDYLLQKMDAVQEGEGTLLDNSLVLYASSLGDANGHKQVDLPVLLAGGESMGVKGGRHVKSPDNTPITNLYVNMLNKLDVPVDKIGDSTGALTDV